LDSLPLRGEANKFVYRITDVPLHAAPGGRPLDKADQPDPIDPLIVTTFTIAIYYYSARKFIVPRKVEG